MTHYIKMGGPPYQKKEVRFGPPLDYVGEKLRTSLEQLHLLVSKLSPSENASLHLAFYNSVVAYTALYVMLADWNSDMPGLVERLTAMNDADFETWLDLVCEDGDVLGHAG